MTFDVNRAARYVWVRSQSASNGQTAVYTLTIAPEPKNPKSPTR